MKVSDYVAEFLAKRGIKHVFAVSGGASMHLIHSVADTQGIEFVCLQHEQACAMAADGYARAIGGVGAMIATSGPGATNLLTGICCSYYDSVPVIAITGQVATFRQKGDSGVRQIGFQETDTVDIFSPVTKYSAVVRDPLRIRYELEKAWALARSGRPGPVLLDIPDDVQRMQVEPVRLEGWLDDHALETGVPEGDAVSRCAVLLANAKRPVLIAGWGIHLAHAEQALLALLDRVPIPVALTWAAADLLPSVHPLRVGTFGTHGSRYANFAVQNADLVISVGSRLDTKATGSPMSTFARGARKIVVDIDPSELGKFARFGLALDFAIEADARAFLLRLADAADGTGVCDWSPWIARIAEWKVRYPICPESYREESDVNPYVFVRELARQLPEGEVLAVDTGCAIAWMMQAFDFKPHQRLYHDFNNTAMGWALPAAIGSSVALGNRPVTCVSGDGSLQMNIQELATVIRHRVPLRMFLINNHGYSMIRQTQDQWMGSRYLASTVEGGLAFPDFLKVATAYGFPTWEIKTNKEIPDVLARVLAHDGPVFCNVEIAPRHRVVPQVKFGRPNEDSEPLLDRREFISNMIVPPVEASL